MVILNVMSIAGNLIITIRKWRRKIKGSRKTRKRRRKRRKGKRRYKIYCIFAKGKTLRNLI